MLTEGQLHDLRQASALISRILREHEPHQGRIAREESEARAAILIQRLPVVEEFEERL